MIGGGNAPDPSMQRALSTHLFRRSVLTVSLLKRIARAGFDLVEIFCDRQHFDYTNRSQMREIAEWFRDSPVKLHSLHAPLFRGSQEASPHGVISITYLERQRRQDSMDEIKRALETAELVPFRYLITHLGVPGEEYDLRKFDAALTSLEHLRLFAGQRGVQLLLENIPNELSTPRRLLEFIRHTHIGDLELCFDSGHAHLDGDVKEAFHLLKDRIASTHLHDNNGEADEHRFPFEGGIAWEPLIGNLQSSAGEVPLLLEARSAARSAEEIPASLDKAAEVCGKFERILEEVEP